MNWTTTKTERSGEVFYVHRAESEGVGVTLYEEPTPRLPGVVRVDWVVCLRPVNGERLDMAPNVDSAKGRAAAECRARAAQLIETADKLEAELLAAADGIPPVWHLAMSRGVRWCGADYPNVRTTSVEAHATCPACAEAQREALRASAEFDARPF